MTRAISLGAEWRGGKAKKIASFHCSQKLLLLLHCSYPGTQLTFYTSAVQLWVHYMIPYVYMYPKCTCIKHIPNKTCTFFWKAEHQKKKKKIFTEFWVIVWHAVTHPGNIDCPGRVTFWKSLGEAAGSRNFLVWQEALGGHILCYTRLDPRTLQEQ